MTNLLGLFVWLRRFSHSRGFGIQSPSVYHYVRYVVNEHYPYYAYSELKKRFPHLKSTERKQFELYFRISNERQTQPWVILTNHSSSDYQDVMLAYIRCASANTNVMVEDGDTFVNLSQWCAQFSSDALLVVEDIRSKKGRERWLQIQEDDATSVTLDLYYCGIVFFDKNRPKSNYIINF